jgi:hypothetical protein
LASFDGDDELLYVTNSPRDSSAGSGETGGRQLQYLHNPAAVNGGLLLDKRRLLPSDEVVATADVCDGHGEPSADLVRPIAY